MSEALIVVPLDGSAISEVAVSHATGIAKATGSSILLVTVWEEGERALIGDLPGLSKDLFRQGEEHYEEYLAGLAKRLEGTGIEVETEVRIGDPAAEVLRVLEQRDPRLLVMATHGRSGLSRWRYGSVAATLAREAPLPTMVVGPKLLEGDRGPGPVGRVLVPLDGSPLAETALRPATDLAESLNADLLLAQVVRWTAQMFAFGTADIDIVEIDRQLTAEAEEYLRRMKEELRTSRPIETVVLHGLPADALIDLVEPKHVDLVVMASHTRKGLARAVVGSVADRLLHGKAPVVLIRPEGVPAITHSPHGRYCHTCGRASPYSELLPDDRCFRCHQHLRACANCVYFDGVTCLLQRSEVHDTYPGQECAYFQFRETAPAKAGAGAARTANGNV